MRLWGETEHSTGFIVMSIRLAVTLVVSHLSGRVLVRSLSSPRQCN